MGLLDALRRNSRSASKHQAAPSQGQFVSQGESLENNENLSPASPAAAADTPLRPKTLSLTPLSSHAPQAAQPGGLPPAAVLRVLGNGHTVCHASVAQNLEWNLSHKRCAAHMAGITYQPCLPRLALLFFVRNVCCHEQHHLFYEMMRHTCSQARGIDWALQRRKAAARRTCARCTSRPRARALSSAAKRRSRCCEPQARRPIAVRRQSLSLRPRRSPRRRCCQRRN